MATYGLVPEFDSNGRATGRQIYSGGENSGFTASEIADFNSDNFFGNNSTVTNGVDDGGLSLGQQFEIDSIMGYNDSQKAKVDNSAKGLSNAQIGLGVVEAAGDLYSGYLGYKNYELAKDQFAFSKASANRDILNQGTLINNSIQNASDVGLALGGGAMTADQIANEKAAVQNRFVDTSKIG